MAIGFNCHPIVIKNNNPHTSPFPYYMQAICLLMLCFSSVLKAENVRVVGLFPGKALIALEGQNPRAVAVGNSLGNVKVIAVESEGALLEIAGHRQFIPMGGGYSSPGASSNGPKSITLSADPRGHFVTQGTINGATMTFLVDTGASFISIGTNDAKRLALNLEGARVVYMNTANGTVPARMIRLNEVNVGGIVLYGVDAVVHDGMQGMALLGMSFLNRMEMKRDGQSMILTKRY